MQRIKSTQQQQTNKQQQQSNNRVIMYRSNLTANSSFMGTCHKEGNQCRKMINGQHVRKGDKYYCILADANKTMEGKMDAVRLLNMALSVSQVWVMTVPDVFLEGMPNAIATRTWAGIVLCSIWYLQPQHVCWCVLQYSHSMFQYLSCSIHQKGKLGINLATVVDVVSQLRENNINCF